LISTPTVFTLHITLRVFRQERSASMSGILLQTSSEMRRMNIHTCGFGPAIVPMAKAVVRVRASYLLSQWVQAPITDWREADT
jgi:hypothetical protein